MKSKLGLGFFSFTLVLFSLAAQSHKPASEKRKGFEALDGNKKAAASAGNRFASQTESRDLSRYDKAGPYDVKLLSPNEEAMRAEIREFLWQHWSEQKLGYVVATFYNKEGEPSSVSYYVEPDQKGVWHVAVSAKLTYHDRVPQSNSSIPRKTYTDKIEYKAYTIERVRQDTAGLKKYEKLPKRKAYPPQSYKLLLINKAQNIRRVI